jgi:hypothetical protein
MTFAIYIAILSIIVIMIFAKSSQTSTAFRVFLVILLAHGYMTTWSTFKQVSGYPTAQDLPKEFEVLWARVVETGEEKFIELWILYDTPTMGKIMARFSLAHGWNNVSRVYRIPYSEENHQLVIEMQRKVREGKKVGITLDPSIDNDIDLREAEQRYSIEAQRTRIRK